MTATRTTTFTSTTITVTQSETTTSTVSTMTSTVTTSTSSTSTVTTTTPTTSTLTTSFNQAIAQKSHRFPAKNLAVAASTVLAHQSASRAAAAAAAAVAAEKALPADVDPVLSQKMHAAVDAAVVSSSQAAEAEHVVATLPFSLELVGAAAAPAISAPQPPPATNTTLSKLLNVWNNTSKVTVNHDGLASVEGETYTTPPDPETRDSGGPRAAGGVAPAVIVASATAAVVVTTVSTSTEPNGPATNTQLLDTHAMTPQPTITLSTIITTQPPTPMQMTPTAVAIARATTTTTTRTRTSTSSTTLGNVTTSSISTTSAIEQDAGKIPDASRVASDSVFTTFIPFPTTLQTREKVTTLDATSQKFFVAEMVADRVRDQIGQSVWMASRHADDMLAWMENRTTLSGKNQLAIGTIELLPPLPQVPPQPSTPMSITMTATMATTRSTETTTTTTTISSTLTSTSTTRTATQTSTPMLTALAVTAAAVPRPGSAVTAEQIAMTQAALAIDAFAKAAARTNVSSKPAEFVPADANQAVVAWVAARDAVSPSIGAGWERPNASGNTRKTEDTRAAAGWVADPWAAARAAVPINVSAENERRIQASADGAAKLGVVAGNSTLEPPAAASDNSSTVFAAAHRRVDPSDTAYVAHNRSLGKDASTNVEYSVAAQAAAQATEMAKALVARAAAAKAAAEGRSSADIAKAAMEAARRESRVPVVPSTAPDADRTSIQANRTAASVVVTAATSMQPEESVAGSLAANTTEGGGGRRLRGRSEREDEAAASAGGDGAVGIRQENKGN
eukprot:TRINITY_DN9866_c1_g3_i2.p1 TRINITY_DN9866_c1_g3~~TRINITY_DN9866_c1_g3_i2.p1  ORF type:complete len:865 (+),score=172.56 TRINITY_DN9866_c1_g3_i2:217-2595(+)